jgi:hypothetical protein
MPQVLEILDHFGLLTVEDAFAIEAFSHSTVMKITEAVAEAVAYDVDQERQAPAGPLEPFRFLAGAAVRGDAGCSQPRCRIRKVNAFVRYAALYCDEVFVPLYLPTTHGEDHARRHLLNAVLTLNACRPLIEAGIVLPIMPSVCPTCFGSAPEFVPVRMAADKLAKEHLGEFRGYALGLLDGRAVIRTEGPPELLEHGSLVTILSEVPEWYPQSCRSPITEIPDAVPPDSRLISSFFAVDRIFREIAMDVVAQIIYSNRMNCGLTYLMGRLGEMEFLSSIKQKREDTIRTQAIAEHLTHEIPVFSEAPIESIVQLRAENRDAFVMYRHAIERIVRGYLVGGGGLTAEDARQIYGDVLAPSLAKLGNYLLD